MHKEDPQRLRLTYSKGGGLRYVGHLDMARAWERVLRRAGVPLAYSMGYNPQPKLQFASALPLGASGRREVADVILDRPMAPERFAELVRRQLPVGLELLEVEIAPLQSKALQALLRSTEWQLDVHTPLDPTSLIGRVEELQAADTWPASRRRKGREVVYDLRPLVLLLRYEGTTEGGWHRFFMRLQSEPGATGRPDAVLGALGLADQPYRMERLACHFA